MRASQTNLVLWATVISESAWAYAALALAGLWMGQDGSPLGWPSVLAVSAASLFVGRLGPSRILNLKYEYLVRTLIGAAVIYVAIGLELASGLPGIDLLWPAKALSRSRPEEYWFAAIVGGFAGAALWLRAGRLAVAGYQTESLAFSFRLGIPVLALATVVDIVSDADLNAFLIDVVFFAAGLGGLAIGHLLPQSQRSAEASPWPKVIAGMVVTVLLVGLTVSLLPKTALDFVSAPILVAVQAVLVLAAWVLFIPIAFVLSMVIEGAILLFDWLLGGGGDRPPVPIPEPQLATSTPSFFLEDEGTGANAWVLQLLAGISLGIIAIVLLYRAAKVFKRSRRRHASVVEGRRESIGAGVDPMVDLASLLWRLRPDWLRRGDRLGFTLPEGPPGIVRVLELYYDLLVLAEERGFERQPHETAVEFQRRIEAVFPTELVRAATTAFVRAFYGNHPSTEGQIAEMRTSVDRLASEPT